MNPALIVSLFSEEEEQKEIAALFNARIHEVETKSDMEKAVKETIIKVKKNRVDYNSRNATTAAELKELVREQAELNKLSKMHISLK